MASMTMVQALNSAMDVMLGRDSDVLVFGEDVGYFGGVFRATEGLQKKYGVTRCFDTPIGGGTGGDGETLVLADTTKGAKTTSLGVIGGGVAWRSSTR